MKQFLIFLCLIFVFTASTEAETFSITYENGRVVRRYPERSHPIIGLALSGGGARGIAHIGVLETIEKMGIRVERIAGTSMGSVVGGLYASGYSPDVITYLFTSNDFSGILSSNPNRRNVYIGQKEINNWPLLDIRFRGLKAQLLPSSWSSGQKLISLLSWVTLCPTYECGRDFDRLPIPFRAVTTNCISGNTKVLGSGNLARAIQASCTIPGLFAPVEWEDSLLIDGGLTNNLPVNVAREMGSDFVIAVAIEESMHPKEDLENPIKLADQVTSIPMRNVTAISRKMADFVISPDMTGFSSKNFEPIEEMIERGRQAALDSIPSLMSRIAQLSDSLRVAALRTIEVSPAEESSYIDGVLSRHIHMGKYTPLDHITESIEELWDSGRYCEITAELDPRSGLLKLNTIKTPKFAFLHIVGGNDTGNGERMEMISIEDDSTYLMQKLIERIESRIYSIRTENSGSTFSAITGQRLNVTRDTLLVTVTTPLLTGIFIDRDIKTRQSLILREIGMETGDTFDLEKAAYAVESLYGTNLYEHVYADVEPFNGGVGFRIHLKEKDWTVARLGIKYDEFNRAEGRLNLSRENIFGFGNQVNISFQTGARTKMFMAENRNDRVFRTMFTFNVRAYSHQRMRPIYSGEELIDEYEDNRTGAILSIGQVMDKLGNVMLQLRSETSYIHYPPSRGMKNVHREYRSVVVRSLIDSYDRYPFPRKGMLNILYLENSSKILGGTEQFVKIFWGETIAKTFSRRHTVIGSLFLGTADPSIPDEDSFGLGGNKLRINCFNRDTAASLFYTDFLGLRPEQKFGTRLASGRVSYRLFIPRYFYLEFLYGAGNVWKTGDTITTDSLLQHYGVQGSFDTYFGPLSVGWGITSHGDDQVYMTAGRQF